MYCYTYLSSLDCGLRELILWSEISSQHPIFFINVARCLNLNLPAALVADLNRIHSSFDAISQEARRLLSMTGSHCSNTTNIAQATAQLMQQFLICDQEFITTIQQLKSLGQDQPVWQTLVHHIESEQIYMYRLISTLMQQIFQATQQPFNLMPPEQP